MGAPTMDRFLSLARRFGRDERGVFAVLFGLMAIVLVALAGAVVDYVALEQARNRSQVALDAAALALQPLIFEEPVDVADIETKAQNLLRDRLGIVEGGSNEFGVEAEIIDAVVNVADGSLTLNARMWMPTMFVSLVGVQELDARLRSEATRKKLAMEVAFVLDNSGSMSYTGAGANGTRQRIQFLKDAANCAVNILFYKSVVDSPTNPDTCIPQTGATKLEDVKIGIVPFTMFVNVGSGNANATWIDQTNGSVIANDNFDNDDDENVAPVTSLPTRATLRAATGEAWRGCVEARPHIKSGTLTTEYLDTDDTAPVTGIPNTLFVPMLSPDMPDTVGGNNYLPDSPAVCDRPATTPTATTCNGVVRRTGCNNQMNNGCAASETVLWSNRAGPVNFSSTTKFPGGYYGAHAPGCACRTPTYGTWTQTNNNNQNNRTFEATFSCNTGYIPTGLSNRELQERVCKYYQTPTSTGFSAGPNADCTRSAILPLTDTPATVTSAITAMTAEGGTNIHEGTVWGMRVLSPTAPFTEGAPYDQATSKVMIMMTDGENTAYNLSTHCSAVRALNGSCYNSAYGFPYNSRNTVAASTSSGNIERLGAHNSGSFTSNADLVTAMNQRTLQTCANAKAAGITVYVIGLATAQAQQSTQAVVESMLSSCASTTDKAYFPQNPGELKDVFRAIADDLSALRLAQ